MYEAWIKGNELDHHSNLQRRAIASSTSNQKHEFSNFVQAHEPTTTLALRHIICTSGEVIQIELLIIY